MTIMNSSKVLIVFAALTLTACSGPPSTPAPSSATAQPAAAVAVPAALPAAAPAPPVPAAKPTAGSETASKSDESKLEKVSPLPAAGQWPAGKWVAGVNYRALVPAQPTDASRGKVEVAEMFWYACQIGRASCRERVLTDV